MNQVNPKHLLNSKWTKTEVVNKEKHFIIVELLKDEEDTIIGCSIEAVINHNQYQINWRELKNSTVWRYGWQ
ncbi:TIGR02450 family Trp-rich protein [Parashewanella curva]|uniref:TIGR02450 family Trp-rich protein n=1 Tax=Parashewanella curva TaxID=2338552 RepID=A0A3L8PW46_9GAMM|nr:TIGR02450 family Trp-rich protein [Parashewanella curva]RLV59019.1 TIGR02450 family Trp-rich protein [Parashewanella curva]